MPVFSETKNRVVHLFSYLYRYPIQDLFQAQIRHGSLDYLEFLQFEKSDDPNHILQIEAMQKKVMDLIDEPKPRIVWCGLLTSTKRKLLIHLVGMSASMWLSLPDIEKMIEQRSKECRDCGSPYENEPFERGKYAGDNEPHVFSFHTTTDTTTTVEELCSAMSLETYGRTSLFV